MTLQESIGHTMSCSFIGILWDDERIFNGTANDLGSGIGTALELRSIVVVSVIIVVASSRGWRHRRRG